MPPGDERPAWGVAALLSAVPPPWPAVQVMDPYRFWEKQKDAANITNPGYSYNSLFGKMIMTVTDAGARSGRGGRPLACLGLQPVGTCR